MDFAINYSPQAVELFSRGQLRVDRLKIPDWADLIESAREKCLPVYIHYGINAGAQDSQTTDWTLADRQARATGTNFINMHLAAKQRYFAPGDDAAGFAGMMADVQRAVEFFGKERVIVENVPLGNPDEDFMAVCGDAAAVCRIVRETGVGFLLDLSHARLTAQHLGVDEREYISKLPVEKIVELHITGLGLKDGCMRDHLPLRPEDWEITERAMDLIARGEWGRPKLLAFEYGWVGEREGWTTEERVILEQGTRLFEMTRE